MFIDWDFIGSLEGRSLSGYVPNPEHSHSGVTIAIGVDLGSVDPTTLPLALREKLRPYCGWKGSSAHDYINSHSLMITPAECDILDTWAAERIMAPLRTRWERDCRQNFNYIPAKLATVVASVAYQYGEVWVHCPRFWSAATKIDIKLVADELLNFGDAYVSRHEKEAAYLKGEYHAHS